MSIEFVRRAQRLFDLDDDVKRATLVGNNALAESKIIEGLADSCFLVQEMRRSSDLVTAKRDPHAWLYFAELKAANRLDEFLNVERDFLRATDFGPTAIDLIILALRHVVDSLIAQQGVLDSSLDHSLALLESLVCGTATTTGQAMKRRPFLKRCFLAAAGSTVVILNLSPGVVAPVSAGSVSLGTWLIVKAAEGTLDAWARGNG